jgi:hypothetical protein
VLECAALDGFGISGLALRQLATGDFAARALSQFSLGFDLLDIFVVGVTARPVMPPYAAS